MTELIVALLTLGVGYATDRWHYARTIARKAAPIVAVLPAGDARRAAEQAVIAANQSEILREIERQEHARRKHDVRLAAIRAGSGEVNPGSLKRED